MSDLTFNKIAGGGLAALLAIFGLRELSTIVFEKHEPEKAGYAITVAEETGGEAGAAADVPPDWGTVLSADKLAAQVAAGQAVSAKCASCHSFAEGGPNGTGPDLYGVLGRKPGSHGGFAYDEAMTGFGAKNPQWDFDHLYEFLKSPQKYIPGTKMTFIGLKKPEDRIAMIAYLHSLGSPMPIPAPKPAGAAPAAAPEGAAAAPAAGGATPTTAPAAGATASAAGAPATTTPAAPPTAAPKGK